MNPDRLRKLLRLMRDRLVRMQKTIEWVGTSGAPDEASVIIRNLLVHVVAYEDDPSDLSESALDDLRDRVSAIETAAMKFSSLSKTYSSQGKSVSVTDLILDDCGVLRNYISGMLIGIVHGSEDHRLPPQPPEQSKGPRFAVVEGKLDLAAGDPLDPERNDIARLKSLLPILRVHVSEAVFLFGRNQAHARVFRSLATYESAISGELLTLDYNLIAAAGTFLANAETAALRPVEDRLVPSFEDEESAALRTILDLHGPFLLSTEVGRSYLADAASYDRTREEDAEFKSASLDLAEAISSEGIATERTESFLAEAAGNISEGTHPARASISGVDAIRNVSAVMVLGALALHPAAVSTGAAWIAAILVAEGVKRSLVGQEAANVVRDALDDPKQRRNLAKLNRFVSRYEENLRRIAGNQREFKFIHDWLDWIASNSADEN